MSIRPSSRIAGAARQVLILSHRYVGLLIAAMFVVWFASGIAMIYAGGMPRLTPQQRLEHLPPLDLAAVRIAPAAAAQRLDAPEGARGVTLTSVLERPAWRFPLRGAGTVFADTGEILQPIDADAARAVAARFVGVPAERVTFVRTIEQPDQWTLTAARELPLHRFRVADAQGTELYVSPQSATVVQLTTRGQRALAWVSTIPHWLYFASLRNDQPLWYRSVVWLSTIATAVAVLGLVLAFTQWRRTRPFRLSAAIPYRRWARWHYITGAVFGLFALTWAFSGLLSMEPYAWTNVADLELDRDALSGGNPDLGAFAALDAAALARAAGGRDIKQLALVRLQGEHYYDLRTTERTPQGKAERLHQPYYIQGRGEEGRVLVSATTLQPRTTPFSAASIVTRLVAGAGGARVTGQALLAEYDDYYYSRGRQLPLPVLRVKLDDALQTWLYVDPQDSALLSQVHRYSRLERWLYNGLHSLDFRFWYSRRPLWDIGVILLCLGGLATSAMGFYLGVKRLVRDLSQVQVRQRAGPVS